MAPRSVRNRLVTTVTACLASAVVAGVVTAAVFDRLGGDGDGHDHSAHAHLDTGSGLMLTNRSALRLCVEAGGGTDQGAVRADLLAGLDRAREHPNWASAYGKARFDPAKALDFGCPAPKLPEQAGRTALAGPGLTDDPSAYRVWVYVLDDATADRVLGPGRPADVATAELMKETNSLWPVSSALLIRQGQLADPTLVAQGLQSALGLASAEGNVTS